MKSGAILTYEDHHRKTGLGGTIAMALAEKGHRVRFRSLGVHRYGDSGASNDVIAGMGLSSGDLVNAYLELLS